MRPRRGGGLCDAVHSARRSQGTDDARRAGDPRALHEAADVSINDSDTLPVLWEPRQIEVPTSVLRVGENLLRIRVYTALIRSFEGQWFDYEAHRYRDVGDV